MKVVIAEDEDSIRQLIVRILERRGHYVFKYPSATEAINHMNENVGLVITDWDMPGMTGVEFIEKIRQGAVVSQGATIPVILMSGKHEDELRQTAERLGAIALPKPFTPADLRDIISSIEDRS